MRIKNLPKEFVNYRLPMADMAWVYVVRCGGLYKIGLSKTLDKRLGGISLLMPFEIEFVNVFLDIEPPRLEKSFHETFANKRLMGEWFRLDEDDLCLVQSVGDSSLRSELRNEQKDMVRGRIRDLFNWSGDLHDE